MKVVFEVIGAFIVSLFLMAIPILCTLSLVYNWFPGLKFILIIACFIELLGLISLLLEIGDKQEGR